MSDVKLAWLGCMSLCIKDQCGRIDQMPGGVYPRTIDDKWKIVINGCNETAKSDRWPELPPYSIYIEYNGWPAGIIGPNAGILAAGDAANEDALIAAIETVLGQSIESMSERGQLP